MAEVQKVVVQIEADTDKATAEVNTFKKAIEDGIGDALKEAGVSAEQFEDGIKSLTKTGTDGFKSLRAQIKAAKEEAQILSQKFGDTSKEALNAQKKVANLTEELDDFNQRVKALNPEAKFNAASNAIQGMIGGLQGVTGALQLFGAESEEVEKIAMKMQGALNLAQGINSVIGLKDAFSNLRVSLGLASVAQNGLNAAMAANPIGAVAIALTLAIGALVAYKVATDDSTEATKRSTEAEKEAYEARLKRTRAFADASKKNKQTEEDLRLQIQRSSGVIDDYTYKLQKLALDEARAIEEIQSKPWSEKSAMDESAVKQIKRIYELRRKLLEIESRKEGANIARGFIGGLQSAEMKSDLQEAAKELAKIIQDELDKIQPIPTKAMSTGDSEMWRNVNAQVKEINRQILASSLDVFDNLLDQQAQGRIQKLEEEKKAGLITEEKYAKEVGKIRRRQALQDRAFAIFNVALNTSEAIMKVSAQLGTFAPPLIAAYTALGAAQTAAILSQPLPKFKKGTLNVGGGNLDSDGGMHAIIHKGEAIIPKDRNRAYHPTIAAIYNKRISPHEINRFVEARTKGRKEPLTATINSNDLYRLKPSDSVNIRNTSILARKIGAEIASNINLRRQ